MMRPAGVSPMVMSKKTMGRVTPGGASREEDMAAERWMLTKELETVMKSPVVEVAYVRPRDIQRKQIDSSRGSEFG